MAYQKTGEWFDIWIADKRSMMATMYRNMASDIESGYDPAGKCIMRQMQVIQSYKEQFDRQILGLSAMDGDRAERWCYYDMVKRGVIEP